jgi:hypothetical protein
MGKSPLEYRTVTAAACQWSHNHLRDLPTHNILLFCANCQKSVIYLPQLWQIAQLLYDHWHIAAVTAGYASELEA